MNHHAPGKYLFIGGPADGERLDSDGSSHSRVIYKSQQAAPQPGKPIVPVNPIDRSVEEHLYRFEEIIDRDGKRVCFFRYQLENQPMLKLTEAYGQSEGLSFQDLQRCMHALRLKAECSHNEIDKLRQQKKGGGKAEELLFTSINTDKKLIEKIEGLIPAAIKRLQETGK